MHHVDKRAALANLGQCLKFLGWKLYDWKENKSDSMTDYYDPESWGGIAEKNGFVVVVDGCGYTAKNSGQDIKTYNNKIAQAEHCTACDGSGNDPGGWTLEKARKSPRDYAIYHLKVEHWAEFEDKPENIIDDSHMIGIKLIGGNSVHSIFPDAVSPIPFKDSGELKCVVCHGDGEIRTYKTEEKTVDVYPVFSANPKSKKWHVQDIETGNIIASGIGLKACLEHNYHEETMQESFPGAFLLAQKIDNSTNKSGSYKIETDQERITRQSADGITLTENTEKQGLELRFPAKPDEDTRNSLKAAGWRWSRFNGCWWKKDSETAREFANTLTGQA